MSKKDNNKVKLIPAEKATITGVDVLERTIFYDRRGFLIETFSKSKKEGPGVYSYCSLTQPGLARDEDKFHFHRFQKDRFTIVWGTMWVLLYDARPKSPTFGKLEVVEAKGGNPAVRESANEPVYTVTIPEGVYHGVRNPGPSWAVLVNHPTREYSPEDEGRTPFSGVPIPSLKGATFSWDKVEEGGR